jgi:NADH-quinone oxidoreductase subunit E
VSAFSAQVREQIDQFIGRYETRRSAILPILHAIQDEYGWVNEAQVEELHEKYDLDRVHVREVITFYSLYHDEPVAKYQVLLCNNLVCCMFDADNVIAKIEQRIKLYKDKGQEPPFSVEGVPCLGVCDGAPAMLVNKDRYLKVTAENVDAILDKYHP